MRFILRCNHEVLCMIVNLCAKQAQCSCRNTLVVANGTHLRLPHADPE